MVTPHTPGPWVVDAIFPDKSRGHNFESRVAIVTRSEEFNAIIRLADIPDVTGRETEEYANATLIAAAPQLLAALKDVLQYCVTVKGMPDKNKGRTKEQQSALDAAREAIAKATGTP